MRLSKTNGVQRLLESVAAMAIRGIRVRPSNWDEGGEVCLCGAVLRATGTELPLTEWGSVDGKGIIKAVARKLGITVEQAASLNNGFEGRLMRDTWVAGAEFKVKKIDRKWYTVGKAFRRQYEKAEGLA